MRCPAHSGPRPDRSRRVDWSADNPFGTYAEVKIGSRQIPRSMRHVFSCASSGPVGRVRVEASSHLPSCEGGPSRAFTRPTPLGVSPRPIRTPEAPPSRPVTEWQYGEQMSEFDQRARALIKELTANPDADFRPGQLEAIREVVENRSRVLVVQRTGWGKSAVYLLATRLLRDRGTGPTLIVSPLLALMRNQLQMTEQLGLNAATVNSTNRDQWDPVFDQIEAGEIDLLLISPERLNNQQFRQEVMPQLLSNIGVLVIDEVHCISDWGHDFRPDYRRLKQIVSTLPPGVPVLGTTATANDRVVADIQDQLGSDLRVFRGTLERESLALQVLRIENKAERMAWLAQHIPHLSGSGIVYCLTIHDAEQVGEWLRSQDIDAATYTGPLDNEARLEIEQRLTTGDLKVVVATSALGMGYDNPKIEFVIHYQTPGSAIAYYQQVGRAGRAVDQSYGIAMSGWEDKDIQDWFITTAFPSEDDCALVLSGLGQSVDGLRMTDIEALVNLRRSRLESMLKILEVEGAVYREGSRWRRSAQRWEYPRGRIDEVTSARRREQEAMQEYVSTKSCLMEFLRRQLDDPGATRCGRCANCRGPMVSPEVRELLVEQALRHIRRTTLVVEPRKVLPCAIDMDFDLKESRCDAGRCLTRWGDPGLARLVENGKYRDGHFDDALVDAMAAMVSEWGPTPRPTWLTWVPSSSGRVVVEDFARRLSNALGLELVNSLRRVRPSQPQKSMQNSCQQARNVAGAFVVADHRAGPVLLVDDVVDSRWTFTILGAQLISAGTSRVYPLALADTSGSGT
jgi:ATP-dependent DNA helicase RecQ